MQIHTTPRCRGHDAHAGDRYIHMLRRCLPLNDEVLRAGVRGPCISILSEEWVPLAARQSDGSPSLYERLLCSSDVHGSFFVPHSVHQSFADAQCWAPAAITRRAMCMGRKEKPHSTHRAVALACDSFLRRLAGDADMSKPESEAPPPVGLTSFDYRYVKEPAPRV